MRSLKWRQLGEILIRDKGIPEDTVRQALREQGSSSLRLRSLGSSRTSLTKQTSDTPLTFKRAR